MTFTPSIWLQNSHIQSILASSPWRKSVLRKNNAKLLSTTETLLLSGGGGIQLLAYWNRQPTNTAPLAILIHGWEGTAESGYLLSATRHLYQQGFQVVRLMLRDHDKSHHLNRELFHSCRLNEVVTAIQNLVVKVKAPENFLGGFSLGGNFSIRIANILSQKGVAIEGIAAVCPVITPADTMKKLEKGPKIYHQYFLKKWRKSLRKKSQLFPDYFSFSSIKQYRSLRKLTDYFVEQHTDYNSSAEYFEGYRLCPHKLTHLNIKVDILMSEDDPMISIKDTLQLTEHPKINVISSKFGGHCGFIENLSFDCWSDRFIFQSFKEKSKIL